MSMISVEEMEFFAYHGCFAEEQIIGTKFLVSIWLETDTTDAEHSDQLSDTVNYQSVYQIVKAEMEIKSKLLEHIGHRIIKAVWKEFPQIANIRIKISKMNPPLGGKVNCVSVEITG